MFKVGDLVICKDGYEDSLGIGGSGYVAGKRFIINEITESTIGGRDILWPRGDDGNNTNGVYSFVCERCPVTSWSGSKLQFNFIK